ncbi:hypothetical protein D3879_06520 [Pseudomonas cavernicola]|uniref:FtsK gamma domain-containing protein n=1 Tax=Pseudomonas cavernicola TaxID=2320866 RepID=A0A418XKE4_9PSED|nr:hypothetical protein D3879_06520 [Pseudomonas cavernicola]
MVPGQQGSRQRTQRLSGRDRSPTSAGFVFSGDELYQKALHAVVTEQRATVGWLQGVLAVTEEQAGVLLDLLEDQGVVGPANDLGGRSVLWATE